MPLEAETPQLDTRTYDRIRREALLRIPRYTPEWTDWNESDPGVTLVELFAWLTETMLYELNRVPERSYLTFLRLLGLELRPAEPASAHLTLTAAPTALPRPGADTLTVPQGARFSGQGQDGTQLLFETTAGIDLIRLELAAVQVFDGGSFTVVTDSNTTPGAAFWPFGRAPQAGSALYLGFAPPSANTSFVGRPFPPQMRWRVFLPTVERMTAPLACRDLTVAPVPPARLVWEHRDTPTRWRQLTVLTDESAALTREGYVVVEGPNRPLNGATQLVATQEGRVADALFWLRIRVASTYPPGLAPEIDFIRPNVVAAVNLATVRDEFVDESQGTPNQTFALRYRPVRADDTFELVVRDPATDPIDGGEPWQRKRDLLASGPNDPHYTLNATTGEIRLGDGTNGRVPPAGFEIIARRYRFGGGVAGNVGPGQINAPAGEVIGVEKVTNERPAVGGRDEQSADELTKWAPAMLRHRDRAVSVVDFETLAAEVGGIAKAKALPLFHPDFPGTDVPGAITVVVIPDNDARAPVPSQDQLEAVCRYLESRRLLTTELYVVPPTYRSIKVTATVAADPYAAPGEVKQAVGKALNRYLDPLNRANPGEPPGAIPPASEARQSSKTGWEFGQDLYPTSLFSVMQQVPNVRAVPFLEVRVDDVPVPREKFNAAVTLRPNEIAYGVAEHEITIVPYKDQ